MRILLTAQCCEKGAVDANLSAHRRLLIEARDSGCELAVFPEMSLTGSVDPVRYPERLVALDGPEVAAMVALTREIGVAAVFGISERTDGGPYITQVFAEQGRLVGAQRKRHLGEDEEGYLAAEENEVFELDGVPFAMAICAEAGFDGPFAHARTVGADLVCFSAAPGLWGRRTTEEEWRNGWDWWCGCGLDDARRHAREQQLWIAISTQAGSTADEDFPGLAALVDPTGAVVSQLDDWHEGTLAVDVPL